MLNNQCLVFAAQWLQKVAWKEYKPGVGGAPSFSTPQDTAQFLLKMASVITNDGNFNGKSPYAERLAICFHQAGSHDDAFRLFEAIVEGGDERLSANRKSSLYCSGEVADKPGLLGYEGMYRFGLLALNKGKAELAKRLFLVIVKKTLTECYPIRLQDIRVACLHNLKKLGMKQLTPERSINAELKAAVDHQY